MLVFQVVRRLHVQVGYPRVVADYLPATVVPQVIVIAVYVRVKSSKFLVKVSSCFFSRRIQQACGAQVPIYPRPNQPLVFKSKNNIDGIFIKAFISSNNIIFLLFNWDISLDFYW